MIGVKKIVRMMNSKILGFGYDSSKRNLGDENIDASIKGSKQALH